MIILMVKLQNTTGHPPHVLEDKRSSLFQTYGEVFSPLRVKAGFLALNYFSWFLFRRLIIIVLLLFLNEYPLIPLIGHILLALFEVLLLALRRPFA